jgi:hypothetical protein
VNFKDVEGTTSLLSCTVTSVWLAGLDLAGWVSSSAAAENEAQPTSRSGPAVSQPQKEDVHSLPLYTQVKEHCSGLE